MNKLSAEPAFRGLFLHLPRDSQEEILTDGGFMHIIEDMHECGILCA